MTIRKQLEKLSNTIFNMDVDDEQQFRVVGNDEMRVSCYVKGHRDARHAATDHINALASNIETTAHYWTVIIDEGDELRFLHHGETHDQFSVHNKPQLFTDRAVAVGKVDIYKRLHGDGPYNAFNLKVVGFALTE